MLYNSVSCAYNKHFNLELTRLLPEDMDVFSRYDNEWEQLRADWGTYQLVQWCNRQHGYNSLKIPLMEAATKTTWGTPSIAPFTDRNGWNGILQDVNGKLKLTRPSEIIDGSCAHFLGSIKAEPLDMRYANAYREILELCQKEKIRAVLVRMPEPPYLQKNTPKELLGLVDEIFVHQAQQYNAEVIDARAWFDTNDVFNDVVHLTVEGSVQFTQKLEDNYLQQFISRHQRAAGSNESASRN